MHPRGQVTVQADRPRTLWLRYKAIAMAEEALGRPFPTLNLLQLGVREYGALLWACMEHEDPSLTIDRVYDLMDEYGLPTFTAKLLEAMASAWPKGAAPGKKGRNASTGTRSSSLPSGSSGSLPTSSGT